MNINRIGKLNRRFIPIVIIGVLFCNVALRGEARPPSKIDLSYDKDTKRLHVVVQHVSENLRKHHIRKLDVSVNDEMPFSHYFPSQTSAAELITDIPLDVAPNDTIRVEAFCSDAGRAEQTLFITED